MFFMTIENPHPLLFGFVLIDLILLFLILVQFGCQNVYEFFGLSSTKAITFRWKFGSTIIFSIPDVFCVSLSTFLNQKINFPASLLIRNFYNMQTRTRCKKCSSS